MQQIARPSRRPHINPSKRRRAPYIGRSRRLCLTVEETTDDLLERRSRNARMTKSYFAEHIIKWGLRHYPAVEDATLLDRIDKGAA